MVGQERQTGGNQQLITRNRGFSQTFYREKVHEKHFGYKDLESFMVGFWEAWATSKGMSGANPDLYDRELWLIALKIRKTSLRCCRHGRTVIVHCKNLIMAILSKQWRVSRQGHSSCLRRRISTFRTNWFRPAWFQEADADKIM